MACLLPALHRMGSRSNQSICCRACAWATRMGWAGLGWLAEDYQTGQRCAGRHAVIDGFALRAEAVIPKPGGDAHGLALEICPLFFIISQAATGGPTQARYRVVGSVTWDRATPEAVRLVEIWVTIFKKYFQLAFIGPRAGSSSPSLSRFPSQMSRSP